MTHKERFLATELETIIDTFMALTGSSTFVPSMKRLIKEKILVFEDATGKKITLDEFQKNYHMFTMVAKMTNLFDKDEKVITIDFMRTMQMIGEALAVAIEKDECCK